MSQALARCRGHPQNRSPEQPGATIVPTAVPHRPLQPSGLSWVSSLARGLIPQEQEALISHTTEVRGMGVVSNLSESNDSLS